MEKKLVKEMVNMAGNFAGISFASVLYRNQKGELARYTINLNVSYTGLLTQDLATLRAIKGTDIYTAQVAKHGQEITDKALAEMITSREKSLTGENERAQANIDSRIALNHNADLFLHDMTIGIHGMLIQKKTIEAGEPYKPVKSQPKTLVKNAFEKVLKAPKYRRFKFESTAMFKTGGKVLYLEAA